MSTRIWKQFFYIGNGLKFWLQSWLKTVAVFRCCVTLRGLVNTCMRSGLCGDSVLSMVSSNWGSLSTASYTRYTSCMNIHLLSQWNQHMFLGVIFFLFWSICKKRNQDPFLLIHKKFKYTCRLARLRWNFLASLCRSGRRRSWSSCSVWRSTVSPTSDSTMFRRSAEITR